MQLMTSIVITIIQKQQHQPTTGQAGSCCLAKGWLTSSAKRAFVEEVSRQ